MNFTHRHIIQYKPEGIANIFAPTIRINGRTHEYDNTPSPSNYPDFDYSQVPSKSTLSSSLVQNSQQNAYVDDFNNIFAKMFGNYLEETSENNNYSNIEPKSITTDMNNHYGIDGNNIDGELAKYLAFVKSDNDCRINKNGNCTPKDNCDPNNIIGNCNLKDYVCCYDENNRGENQTNSSQNSNSGNNVSNNMSKNLSNNMSQNLSNNMGQNLSNNMGQNLSNNMGQNLSNNMSQNLSNNMGQNLSNNMSQNLSNNNSSEFYFQNDYRINESNEIIEEQVIEKSNESESLNLSVPKNNEETNNNQGFNTDNIFKVDDSLDQYYKAFYKKNDKNNKNDNNKINKSKKGKTEVDLIDFNFKSGKQIKDKCDEGSKDCCRELTQTQCNLNKNCFYCISEGNEDNKRKCKKIDAQGNYICDNKYVSACVPLYKEADKVVPYTKGPFWEPAKFNFSNEKLLIVGSDEEEPSESEVKVLDYPYLGKCQKPILDVITPDIQLKALKEQYDSPYSQKYAKPF